MHFWWKFLLQLITRPPAGRKRRRSMSPYDRERYDPRPRYSDDYGLIIWSLSLFLPCDLFYILDAHSRYGYASSPRRHAGAYAPTRRAPPDPHTFEFPATLKQYAEWFRFCFPVQAAEEDSADKAAEHEAGDGSKPRNGIKSRWEKYKKDFAANQVSSSPPPPLFFFPVAPTKFILHCFASYLCLRQPIIVAKPCNPVL